MGVSGDFGALRGLQFQTSEPQLRALAPTLAKQLGAAAIKLLADEFKQGRDPYGAAWLKTKRGNPPLRRSGRMAGSVTAQPNGDTVKVTIGTTYAVYHQDGTRAHPRKGGAIPVNKRGRFQSKGKLARREASVRGGVKQRVRIFGAYTNGGIPRRQMLPEESTGGLGPVWSAAFLAEERVVIVNAFGGR